MPELPEAENICRALRNALCGKMICKVEIFSPAMRTSLMPLVDAALEKHFIIDIRRRGRYLVAELDDGRGLLMHFGMSGVVRVETPDVPRRKHEHAFIHLDDGKIFRFECTRRFSILEVCENCGGGKFPSQLDQLGVEPLSDDFTSSYLFNAFSKRRGAVKNALMDNKIVTGVGNIYANESLFACGISPLRPACEVTAGECELLVENVKSILLRAIECGGSTISDFRNVDGSEGKFARELKIYDCAGKNCSRCGNIVKSVRIGGRSSFYCEGCQK